MIENRRAAERYPIQLQVELENGGEVGVSRDMSVRGICFETTREFAVGAPIAFGVSVNAALDGEPVHVCCRGRVVRVDYETPLLTVAASIDHVQIGTRRMAAGSTQ